MSVQTSDLEAGGAFTWSPQAVDVSGDINSGANGNTGNNWFSGLVGGLASLFDNGVKIYNSVAGQAAANALIKAQTDQAKAQTAAINTPSSSLLSKDNLNKILIVAVVGVAALFLIKKLKVA
jgi:hypothetical protein